MLKHLESTGITFMSGSPEAQDIRAHLRINLGVKHATNTDHQCIYCVSKQFC